MDRVLLTGASGFIGRQCLEQLMNRGVEIHAVSRRTQKSTADVTWHELDLLKDGAVRGLISSLRPTHLLNLAWNAEPGLYWTTQENLRWVRVGLEMIEAFSENNGERIVMAGTCAEYDWNYGWCSESKTPLSPVSLYGKCKYALFSILESYSKQVELSSAWGRVFFMYGPQEHSSRLVSSVTKSLLLGQPARCTAGTQIRDFMHVSDVASAFIALLDSSVQGAVNIASGEGLMVRDLVRKIAIETGNSDLLRLGEIPIAVSDPPLLLADIRRLRDEVGWSNSIKLDQGLADVISWWRTHLKKGAE